MPNIHCYVIKLELPAQSHMNSTIKHGKGDGWISRNFLHHFIEYQKDDGFYEFVNILDEPGMQSQIYQARLVTWDLVSEKPYAVVSIRSSLSYDQLHEINPHISLIHGYDQYLYAA